jgi:hypothetical protein
MKFLECYNNGVQEEGQLHNKHEDVIKHQANSREQWRCDPANYPHNSREQWFCHPTDYLHNSREQ